MEACKLCYECGSNKLESEYCPSQFKLPHGRCRLCRGRQEKIYKKQYREKNKEKISAKRHEDYINNEKGKVKYEERLEYARNYYYENKEEINRKASIREANKKKTNPEFKCMKNISRSVAFMLKSKGGSKNGVSSKTKLPFTAEQLWQHLESLFTHPDSLGPNGEVWMTKENHGSYISDQWNEEDSTTWRWHIDHIKPKSDYPYDSMDHPNFLIVWDLSNLRPLCAKRNQEEGAQRTRHKPKKEVK